MHATTTMGGTHKVHRPKFTQEIKMSSYFCRKEVVLLYMYLTKLGCASSESVFDLSFHDNVYFEDDNSTEDPEYVPESQGLND